MTDLHANSKLDTVLLLDTDLGSLGVDHSQYETDLNNAGSYFDESPSARTAIAAPREVTVVFQFNTVAGSGTLVDHSGGGVVDYRVELVGSSFRCIEGASTRASMALPGATTTTQTYLAQWSQFPEGTQVRSELAIYNFDTNAWVFATPSTHSAAAAPDPNRRLAVKARADGSNVFPQAIEKVRIGCRYHSQTEAMEDWVSATPTPSVGAAQRCEGTPVDRSTEIGGHGAFAGPAVIATGRATKQASRRLLSPLVNRQVASPLVLQSTYVPDEWHRVAWGATTSRLVLALLFRRPVPPVVRYAWVRVHVLQYTVGAGVVPVYLRGYSFNRIPGLFTDGDQPTVFHTAETSINTNHTSSGAGEWLTLGLLPVARDSEGFSYFCISYDFNHDVADANLANTRLQIRAVTIEPYPSDSNDGPNGLDILEG
jgi:hypothetical protein